jgi:uncharacterized membrane protein YfcA
MKSLLVWIVVVVLEVILLPVSSVSTTSQSHAPRQHQQHLPQSDHSSIPAAGTTTDFLVAAAAAAADATIHVLPPSPDDKPMECHGNSTLYVPCGSERYCAPLHEEEEDNTINTTPKLYCLHKTLWSPTLTASDLVAFLLTGGCCFLAAMAGIGGGGLILPILLLGSNFTPKEATVLSNTAVFCNTLGQFGINNYNNYNKYHYRATTNNSDNDNNNHRGTTTTTATTLVVLATVLMIMPSLIAGGSVAITLEGMIPSTVILILAFLTLTLATTKTYHKANKMRLIEQQQQQQQQQPEQQRERLATPPTMISSAITTQSLPSTSRTNTHSLVVEQHQQQQDEDNDEKPAENPEALLTMALEWGSVLAGVGGSPSTITRTVKVPESPSGLLENPDEENFLGSIRYLGNNEDSSDVLIIDETSMSPSSSSQGSPLHHNDDDYNDDDDNDDGNREDEPRNDLVNDHPPNNENGRNDRQEQYHNNQQELVDSLLHGILRSFVTQYKLQLFIGGFWILDAITFLLVHTGTLVTKCSPLFFLLVIFPALVAALFVTLGRSYLVTMQQQQHMHQQQQQQQQITTTTIRTEEQRPLMMMTINVPENEDSEDEDNDDDDDDGEPVHTLAAESDDAGQPQAQPSSSSRQTTRRIRASSNGPQPLNWVLSGMMRTLGLRRHYAVPQDARQGSRTVSRPDSMSRPLLLSASPSTEEGTNGQNEMERRRTAHDNFKSLLAWWLPCVSVVIGFLSALLGIGGGELLGPILLLLLQMDPQQSSATTAVMSVMNSGTNLLHHIVAGMMIAPGYALHLGLVGIVGGCGGRLYATNLAEKGRPSIIALSLCGVLGLATVLVAIELVTTPVSFQSKAGIC